MSGRGLVESSKWAKTCCVYIIGAWSSSGSFSIQMAVGHGCVIELVSAVVRLMFSNSLSRMSKSTRNGRLQERESG